MTTPLTFNSLYSWLDDQARQDVDSEQRNILDRVRGFHAGHAAACREIMEMIDQDRNAEADAAQKEELCPTPN